MRSRIVALAMALAAVPGTAIATTNEAACPPGHICASTPQGVADELRKLGYRADLSKHKSGDPQIESSASGYEYWLNFNDCTSGKQCRSLSFIIVFEDDGKNTPELANACDVPP